MRANVRDYGAKGDGAADDTAAFVAARNAVAATVTRLPWGDFHGGGVIEVPAGVYRIKQPLSLTPLINGTRAQQLSLVGEGRMASVLMFDGCDGVALCDAVGVNLDCHTRVSDVGILSPGIAVRNTGGGQCLLERSMMTGTTGLKDDAANGTTARDCSFYGPGVGAELVGDSNGTLIERCQFNGPSVAVWHAGGVGHRVHFCNSEGALLGRFTSAIDVEHVGWQHEGSSIGWHFDDQGSAGYTLCAQYVTIRGGFTSAPAPIKVDPHATVYHLRIDGAPAAPNASGAFIQNASWASLQGETYVSGALRSGVTWFQADPGAAHDLGEVGRAAYVPGNPNGNAPVLPVAREGATAFAWHGRKAGEGPGAGTGVPVYFSGGAWRVVGTDAVVTT